MDWVSHCGSSINKSEKKITIEIKVLLIYYYRYEWLIMIDLDQVSLTLKYLRMWCCLTIVPLYDHDLFFNELKMTLLSGSTIPM